MQAPSLVLESVLWTVLWQLLSMFVCGGSHTTTAEETRALAALPSNTTVLVAAVVFCVPLCGATTATQQQEAPLLLGFAECNRVSVQPECKAETELPPLGRTDRPMWTMIGKQCW